MKPTLCNSPYLLLLAACMSLLVQLCVCVCITQTPDMPKIAVEKIAIEQKRETGRRRNEEEIKEESSFLPDGKNKYYSSTKTEANTSETQCYTCIVVKPLHLYTLFRFGRLCHTIYQIGIVCKESVRQAK